MNKNSIKVLTITFHIGVDFSNKIAVNSLYGGNPYMECSLTIFQTRIVCC